MPQTREFYRKIKLWRIKFRYMYQHVQLNGDKSPLIFKRKIPYLVHVSLIPCIGSTVWTACRSTFPRTTPISEDDRTVCPSLALFLQSPTTDVLPVMHCRLFHYIMKQLLEISYRLTNRLLFFSKYKTICFIVCWCHNLSLFIGIISKIKMKQFLAIQLFLRT